METREESTKFGNSFCPIVLNTDTELSSQAAQEKNLEKTNNIGLFFLY